MDTVEKIDRIWAAAIQSGDTQAGRAWLRWYYESIVADEIQPLPSSEEETTA